MRVAVLGFWHVHAGDYAQQTVDHPGTELVAVWDDDTERGRAGAERFGVEYTDDLDALLARTDVDAVTITTSTDVHRDVIERAAAAGKHVFTEKLLAPTVEECDAVIAACDAADVKLGGLAPAALPRLHGRDPARARRGPPRRRHVLPRPALRTTVPSHRGCRSASSTRRRRSAAPSPTSAATPST
ncbi:Gfo/Idh/MocA family oxidoreductase [Sphingomonas sp. LR61]|uniref:Gfo/Idh/MocA family protein n=1 Tax=Sphingomonas sp. LR61 TaxID=3050234 RepID=UPI002FE15402